MNWFMDMLKLFMEWALLMIIPLLIGIFIGWVIWHKKDKDDKKDNKEAKEEKAEEQKEDKEERKSVDDDLSAIDGIDADAEAKLKDKGITSYYDLATLKDDDVDGLEKDLELESGKIREGNWTHKAAQKHFETYDEEIYEKVNVEAVYKDAFEKQFAETMKGVKLDYEDDLKIISGVGPKLEGLLHDFGITTFYQVSKLDTEGIRALNEKIKSFPGRMERDDWIGQAKKLHKEHHGE